MLNQKAIEAPGTKKTVVAILVIFSKKFINLLGCTVKRERNPVLMC